jgi:hypothetical protein
MGPFRRHFAGRLVSSQSLGYFEIDQMGSADRSAIIEQTMHEAFSGRPVKYDFQQSGRVRH